MTRTHQTLILSAVQHVPQEKLCKAVCGLADGSLTVTITRQTEVETRGLVRNGSGSEYGVTLAEGLTSCSCKDALYRGGICKHAAALALHALRMPAEEKPQPKPITSTTHLMWSNGAVLCGEQHPERIWCYPWPEGILNNTRQWPEVDLCRGCLEERNQPGHSHMRTAA